MSVTSGVIVGGGRIGSYLHETNGTTYLLFIVGIVRHKRNRREDLKSTHALSNLYEIINAKREGGCITIQ